MARTHQQFVTEVANRNISNPLFQIKIKKGSSYINLDTDMIFECSNGHVDFVTKPRYIIQKLSGCPLCRHKKAQNSNNKGLITFIRELSAVHSNNIKILPKQQYINTNTPISCICRFGHNFDTIPKTLLAGHGCPICANNNKRKKLHSSSMVTSSTSTIQSELDRLTQYLPIKIQIIPIDKPYDKYLYTNLLKQSLSCDSVTIFIFEDEWISNQELIISKINHYSNNSNVSPIPARKCVIKQILNSEKRELLTKNHIQGNDNAPLSYGAYYSDKLVAVMTFSAPRVAVGAASTNRERYEGMWELSRFCTDVNYRIPGIASKLLKHFQRNNNWIEIYSFADRRWSVGNMYYKLGFELTATNPPAYFYVVDGKRKHRWNYRKDLLRDKLPNYDAKLTEYENMQNHGFWRVWDCGTLKFTMRNSVYININ